MIGIYSSCIFLGMMTGLHEGILVQDIEIDNKKIANGMAVGRASECVDRTLAPFLSGSYTIIDNYLYIQLNESIDKGDIRLELVGTSDQLNCIKREKTIYKKCFKTEFESRYTYCMGNRGKYGSKRSNGRVLSNRFLIN